MDIQEFIENFAEQLEIDDLSSLSESTKFRELDEWSSLGGLMMIGFIKDTFSKDVTATDIRACETIGDMYNFANS